MLASAADAAPGQNVDVHIRTRPNSIVGLLAVDENVARLGSGNDLSADEVYDEMADYATGHEQWNPVDQAAYGRYSAKFEVGIAVNVELRILRVCNLFVRFSACRCLCAEQRSRDFCW